MERQDEGGGGRSEGCDRREDGSRAEVVWRNLIGASKRFTDPAPARLSTVWAAARLILIELIHTQNILGAFQLTKLWTPNQLSRSFWESEGTRVAAALKPEELVTVGRPYLYVQSLEALGAKYEQMNNLSGMFHDPQGNDMALLNDGVAACSEAIDFLRTYAGFNDQEFDRLQKAARK